MAIIISNIYKLIIPGGLFIWALFMPYVAGYIYVAIYGLFEGYLFFIDRIKKKPEPEKWSTEEIEIINKYYLALRFPLGAREMSVHLNGFRWAGIIWSILFLFNHMWFAAAFVLISFYISSSISVRLDPFFFLGRAVASGQMQFANDLSLLYQVSEKSKEYKEGSVKVGGERRRPILVTIVCALNALLLLLILLFLIYAIVDGASTHTDYWEVVLPRFAGALFEVISGLLVLILIIAATVGYWKMKRWGLYLYTIMTFVFILIGVTIQQFGVMQITYWLFGWVSGVYYRSSMR